jgi:hypothetical protein
MKKNRLVSMIYFVLNHESRKDSDPYNYSNSVLEYANFLNQSLNLGMFFPAIEVDGKWEVLKHPSEYDIKFDFRDKEEQAKDYKQYQQAKDRVLFEGFELNRLENSIEGHFNYNTVFVCRKDYSNVIFFYKTINDLIKYAPTLTAKGQKDSGLG